MRENEPLHSRPHRPHNTKRIQNAQKKQKQKWLLLCAMLSGFRPRRQKKQTESRNGETNGKQTQKLFHGISRDISSWNKIEFLQGLKKKSTKVESLASHQSTNQRFAFRSGFPSFSLAIHHHHQPPSFP